MIPSQKSNAVTQKTLKNIDHQLCIIILSSQMFGEQWITLKSGLLKLQMTSCNPDSVIDGRAIIF